MDQDELELLSQYEVLSEGSDIDASSVSDFDEVYSLDTGMVEVDPLDLDQIRTIRERQSDSDSGGMDEPPSPPIEAHQESWTTDPQQFTSYAHMPGFTGKFTT